MILRSLFLVTSSLIALSLVACTTAPEESEMVGSEMAAQIAQPSSCLAGAAFRAPGSEEDIGILASARAPYVRTGHTFGAGLEANAAKNPVTVLAVGTGAFAGNFQYVAREDWKLCGGAMTIAAKAHAELGGGGLSQSQLQACATDLERPECSTLAHYCEPKTLEVSAGKAPRCALKAGVPVDVRVHGGPACVSGASVRGPAFDDELTPITTASKPHDASGYALTTKAPAGTDVLTTVLAFGSGDFEGNIQRLVTSAWQMCGSQLLVQPTAQIEFLGGGLTTEQLESCEKDLGDASCATLAHYCKPGSFHVPQQLAPRCILREGIEVRATFSRRAQ